MTDQRSPWLLQHSPETAPPTLAQIRLKVRRRSRRRAVYCVTAATCLLAPLWVRNDATEPPQDSTTVASNVYQPMAADSHLANEPRNRSTDDPPNPFTMNAHAIETTPLALSAGFNLYATIHDDTPVFHFDDQRGEMVPIGWVRSIDTIPVELAPLSTDQIDTLESLLDDHPQSHFF